MSDFYYSYFYSDVSISGMPSCCECSISPERRKVTVGSAVLGSEEVPDSVLNQPITSEKRSQRKNQPTTVVEHKSLRTETPEKNPQKVQLILYGPVIEWSSASSQTDALVLVIEKKTPQNS